MTLYTFDKDTMPGKSVCNGPFAQNWPPLPVSAGAEASGDWSVVSRDDGSKQWAYKGKPLYTWVKDQKQGDTTGNGFLNNARSEEHTPELQSLMRNTYAVFFFKNNNT